jgi:hypothetical protein
LKGKIMKYIYGLVLCLVVFGCGYTEALVPLLATFAGIKLGGALTRFSKGLLGKSSERSSTTTGVRKGIHKRSSET